VVNIASRSAKFITKNHDGILAAQLDNEALWQQAVDMSEDIASYYEHREYSKAIREIMALADATNEYFDSQEPWKLAKEAGKEQQVLAVSSQCINLFRLIMLYLKPVLPATAEKAEAFLNDKLDWSVALQPLLGHKINNFTAIMTRVDSDKVDAMIEASKESQAQAATMPASQTTRNEIEFDDFARIDLRVAEIINAEAIEGADKLLKLTLSLGEEGQRQVMAGIKGAYQPEQLVGKLTVMVANLKPRKMKFGISEGMVLAAGPGGKEIWLLEPDQGAQPGMVIK
jgi:methionyl-tRNA synthetase